MVTTANMVPKKGNMRENISSKLYDFLKSGWSPSRAFSDEMWADFKLAIVSSNLFFLK